MTFHLSLMPSVELQRLAANTSCAHVDGAHECPVCGMRFDRPAKSSRPLIPGTCSLVCTRELREPWAPSIGGER